ncbi:hypothetical protein AB0910_20645 [Streptomyces sp. NPDC047002]|uniref:hypothetical protein n=1 Tax=Streptomyces sp. NPDC047002 TaxID=3155475 RepID=UPI0034519FF8
MRDLEVQPRVLGERRDLAGITDGRPRGRPLAAVADAEGVMARAAAARSAIAGGPA